MKRRIKRSGSPWRRSWKVPVLSGGWWGDGPKGQQHEILLGLFFSIKKGAPSSLWVFFWWHFQRILRSPNFETHPWRTWSHVLGIIIFFPSSYRLIRFPQILLEFAPPKKKSKKWGNFNHAGFFQRQDIVWVQGMVVVGQVGMVVGQPVDLQVTFGRLWDVLSPTMCCKSASPWPMTMVRDGRVYSLRFVVGCFFFFEIERDMMAMKWEVNLFLGLFWWVSIEVKDAPRNTLEDFGKIEDSISKSHLKTCSVVATVSLLGEMNCKVPILGKCSDISAVSGTFTRESELHFCGTEAKRRETKGEDGRSPKCCSQMFGESCAYLLVIFLSWR